MPLADSHKSDWVDNKYNGTIDLKKKLMQNKWYKNFDK